MVTAPSAPFLSRQLRQHMSKKLKNIIIVCSVIGGLAVLVGVLTLLYYYLRHRRNAAFIVVAHAVEASDSSNNDGDVEMTVGTVIGDTVASPAATVTATAIRADRKGWHQSTIRHDQSTATLAYAMPITAAQRTAGALAGTQS